MQFLLRPLFPGHLQPFGNVTRLIVQFPGRAVFRSHIERRICRLLALAILIAIAAVLISPAVPSAPTLLPVATFLLLGLILVCSHALMGAQSWLQALRCVLERTTPDASLALVSPGLPLLR